MKIKDVFIILFSLSLGTNLYAQDANLKSHERDVKISGNYYYGDGLAPDEKGATELAMEDLKLMISENLKEDNRGISTVEFKGFEQSIGTIVIPLMNNRVRTIAFVLKKEIKTQSSGTKKLMVIRLMPNNGIIEDKQVVVPNEDKPIKDNVIQASTANRGSSESIISQLTKLNESKDVGVLLNSNKSKGKLLYGRLTTMKNPEKCYYVILKGGKLIDVLDKSTGNNRTGLVSGNNVDYTTVRDIIYWIYINE